MVDRSDDPAFEYARLCELQSDITDVREAIHVLHNYLSRPPASADGSQSQSASPQPSTVVASATATAAPAPANAGWNPSAFALELKNMNEIACAAVRKFNETQKLLPPVGRDRGFRQERHPNDERKMLHQSQCGQAAHQLHDMRPH